MYETIDVQRNLTKRGKYMQIYNLIDRKTKQVLNSHPTFNREDARGNKQLLKSQGLDPVIIASKLDVVNNRVIR
jgi:hypothetical protein